MIAASGLPANPDLLQSTNYMLICFLTVVAVLAILMLMTSAIGLFFKAADRRKAACAPCPAGAPQAPAAVQPTAESARIAAIISAAVYAVMDGAQHRIVSVKSVPPDFNWANSGRNAIFASKNPKK